MTASINPSRVQTKDRQLMVLFFVFASLLFFNLGANFFDFSSIETEKIPGQITGHGQEILTLTRQGRGEETKNPRLSFFLNQPMNINQATTSDLELINGIGPRTAERIIKYRDQYGKFTDIHELENIHGIGPGTSRKISKYVSFK